MARRTIHLLDDDLDGCPADETVRFALDGVDYTIDLSTANAARLREAVGPFLRAATCVRRGSTPNRRSGTGRRSSPRNPVIREWGRAAGYKLRDRGRLPRAVVEAYHTSTAGNDA